MLYHASCDSPYAQDALIYAFAHAISSTRNTQIPFFLAYTDLRGLPHQRSIPSRWSPDYFHVSLHLHNYHTEPQLFGLLTPSLGCEFPEVSDFCLLPLSFTSRVMFLHFGHTINACWMEVWVLESMNKWMNEWMNTWKDQKNVTPTQREAYTDMKVSMMLYTCRIST